MTGAADADAARERASQARLAERGYEDVAGLLRALHGDEHQGVRAEAAFLLGRLGDDARAALGGDARAGLAGGDDDARAGLAGGDDARAGLAAAARDDGAARVRVEAALALGRLGDPAAALPILRAEVEGAFFADAPIRAARALALLGDASGWPRIEAALASDQPAERMEAVASLSAFVPLAGATIDPVAALHRASGDPEPVIANDARAALEHL